MNIKRSSEINLPQLIRRSGSEELPALKLSLIAVLVVSCENLVYGFSGQLNALNAIDLLQNERWQAVEALLYAGGSPFEGGSQLENGKLNFQRDFAFFRLSGIVFEGFCSPMLASFEPSVNGLPSGVEEFCDAGDC